MTDDRAVQLVFNECPDQSTPKTLFGGLYILTGWQALAPREIQRVALLTAFDLYKTLIGAECAVLRCIGHQFAKDEGKRSQVLRGQRQTLARVAEPSAVFRDKRCRQNAQQVLKRRHMFDEIRGREG